MKTMFPKSVVLELTYKCNHKCLFCSCPWETNGYSKGKELSYEEWKQAIDILYSLGIEYFSISGGEALLKDCLPQILEYIRNKGEELGIHQPIVLISNGRVMTEEYLKLFKDLNVHLSMSLPGYSTFKEHTGVDNADGVLHWFQKAKEIGLDTTVNVTVTRKNIHELFETLSFGLLNGASDVLLNRFLPGGRGLSHIKELKLSASQINEMLDVAEEVLGYSNRYGSVGTEIALCAVKDIMKYKRLNIGYQCAAAKGFFVIDPSGKVRTCNHSPRVVGHIFNKPIVSDTAYWNTFANSEYKPEVCKTCKAISICDCGCREVANILNGNCKSTDSSLIIKEL